MLAVPKCLLGLGLTIVSRAGVSVAGGPQSPEGTFSVNLLMKTIGCFCKILMLK